MIKFKHRIMVESVEQLLHIVENSKQVYSQLMDWDDYEAKLKTVDI